jgi:signal transduction histidine kinase
MLCKMADASSDPRAGSEPAMPEQTLRLVHAAMMNLRQPIVIYDANEYLQTFNHAFAELHHDDGRCILRPGMHFREIAAWRMSTSFYAAADDADGDDDNAPLRQTARTQGAYIHRLRDGRWMLVDRYRLADGSNLGVWSDVTMIKRAEVERHALEAQLHHARRLEALGTLAGGVAHELNNTLVPVIALTKLVLPQLAPESRAHRNLGTVIEAGERARGLVRQILTFSRNQEMAREVLDLAALTRETLDMLRSSIPTSIEISAQIAAVPPILGDGGQLSQVIVNLVTNAACAIGKRSGKIVVSLEAVAPVAPVAAGTAAGSPCLVRLSVADTGAGMDQATLSRVFEPFFTTKKVGEGTGLGLAIAHGIVTSHGGAITAQSRLGEGSVFCVSLPANRVGEAA